MSFIHAFRALVETHKPAVVHIGAERRHVVHTILAMRRFPAIPVLVDRGANRGLSVLNPADWIGFFTRRNQAIVCVAESMKAHFAADPTVGWLLPLNRLEVLPLCTQPDIDSELSREQARAELGIPSDAFVVGSVCQIRPVKNLGVAAEAVARLTSLVDNIRFAVIGGLNDAAEVRRIQRRGGGSGMLFGPPPGGGPYLKAVGVFVRPPQNSRGGCALSVFGAI